MSQVYSCHLILHWLVGIFYETLHCRRAERALFPPSSAANERLPEDFGPCRCPGKAPNAQQKRPGQASQEHSRICAL